MKKILFILVLIISIGSCKEKSEDMPCTTGESVQCDSSMPIGEDYDLGIPFYVPVDPVIPDDNPMKMASVNLGRFLFWDTRLSGDNSMSCGTCHSPQAAFSDPAQFSVGIDGSIGTRNSMALVNLVLQPIITWDGGQPSLEAQSEAPVENVIEMHDLWDDVLIELEADDMYGPLFEEAYGSPCIDKERSTKAIAQFIRSMTSFGSKYDRAAYGPESFTALEEVGLNIWSLEGGVDEPGQGGADCFHCHSIAFETFTDNDFHNNGLDSVFTDLGQGGVTGIPAQYGKFKTPTLRNIEYSAPYMHDGRFQTLEEVVEHYNTGGTPSATIDPFMKYQVGGLELTAQKKAGLIAFMKTLSDPDFINNPDFQDPF